ncbi:MAG: M20/M25/M40 family metallo-hydrolase [Myxococcota bacterium]
MRSKTLFEFSATLLMISNIAYAAEMNSLATNEEIAERIAGAIRFETISPENAADFDGEPFDQLVDYLESHYPRVFRELELEKVNQYTLLFKWQGSEQTLAPALFMAHLDVVPVEGAALEKWTHPPFAGVIEDGYVWGRGTLDVKTGAILWLEAIESLLAEGFVPQRTIYLSLGHDEEIGGEQGAVAVAQKFRDRGIRPAFLFDEGGLILDGYALLPNQTTALIVVAEKAFFTVHLTARGVSGHSSMPPQHTAIGKLARAIVRVEENPMPTRLIAPVREMLLAASPHLSFGRRLAFQNLWLTSGFIERQFLSDPASAALIRTTFAATIISGGVKDNVIPELAEATINVRRLPGDSPSDVLDHLRRVIDDPEIEIEGANWGDGAPPAPVDGVAFRLAADAVKEVMPEAIVIPGLVPGATDSRHFAGLVDEILRFIPMRVDMELVSGMHGRDERIAVEYLSDSLAIAIGMVRRAATSPSDPDS